MRNGATQFLKQTENWTKQNLNCIKNINTNTKTDTTRYDYKTFKTSNVMYSDDSNDDYHSTKIKHLKMQETKIFRPQKPAA